jgi:hypothetical protein
MKLPDFYARVPRLRTHDPLADVLGSAEGGFIEYGYDDAVKLAGHSCPTVASAYWLTYRALSALYPDRLPQRGNIRVDFRDDLRDGTAGVVASVVQLLTGAAGESGFKGMAGKHVRSRLQRFSPDLPMALRFTRLDTQAAVDASADLSLLPEPPGLTALLRRCNAGDASPADLRALGALWQERVARLLLDMAYDDGVFVVRPARWPWPTPAPPAPLLRHRPVQSRPRPDTGF